MTNQKIRDYAKKNGVLLWEIADRLNINDGNFSRKLRKELSRKEELNIMMIIDEIKKQKG